MTPLVFEVLEYRGEKSGGQIRAEAKYTLKISIRGQRQEGPIATIPAVVSLVRGPDRMWYLESGTLPETPREEADRSLERFTHGLSAREEAMHEFTPRTPPS